MANLNKVMLIGRLTRDPKSTTSPKGTAITELSLAVNRTYAGEDERMFEETTFTNPAMRCSAPFETP